MDTEPIPILERLYAAANVVGARAEFGMDGRRFPGVPTSLIAVQLALTVPAKRIDDHAIQRLE